MKFQTKVICEASKWERERAGRRGRGSVWCCRLRWQPISSLLECTPKSNPAATTICGLKILNCWNLKTDFSARNWSSARKTTRRRRKKPASQQRERERRKEGNCRRDSARHEPVAMFAIRFGATQTEDWDSDSPLSLQLRLRNLDDNEAENLRQRRFKRKKLKLENSLELLSWKLAPDPGPCPGPGPCPAAVLNANEECGGGGRVSAAWSASNTIHARLAKTNYKPEDIAMIIMRSLSLGLSTSLPFPLSLSLSVCLRKHGSSCCSLVK